MNCKYNKCGASFKTKLALTFYSLFSVCCINLFAQNCNYKLSVQVIDLHDGTPLSNANIEINELEILGKTDFDGNVVFENLCEDSYLLTISHKDCESLTQTIDLKKDTFKKIRLEHHLNELDEILVIKRSRK